MTLPLHSLACHNLNGSSTSLFDLYCPWIVLLHQLDPMPWLVIHLPQDSLLPASCGPPCSRIVMCLPLVAFPAPGYSSTCLMLPFLPQASHLPASSCPPCPWMTPASPCPPCSFWVLGVQNVQKKSFSSIGKKRICETVAIYVLRDSGHIKNGPSRGPASF